MVKEPVRKKRASSKLILLANVLLILGLGVFGGYYFKKYHDLKKNPLSAEQAAQAEVDRTIAKVSKLYGSLPTDEKPSVATVSDKAKLKEQPFFDKSVNGDVTLIYSNAKLAILYRPSTNQIINVSSVTIQSSQLKVVVIGDATARAAVEKTIKDQFANDAVVSGSADTKTIHTGITVVDLSGQHTDVTKKLAAGLKGQVGGLPDGEQKPTDADILIVAGNQP